MAVKRFRLKFMFWLDVNKDGESELAEQIEQLKRMRLFSRTIRDGIRLICDLREGHTDVLFELFPWLITQSNQSDQAALPSKQATDFSGIEIDEIDDDIQPDRASDQLEQLFAELDYQRREANDQIAQLYQELADEKHQAGRQLEAMFAELAEIRQTMRPPSMGPDLAEMVSSGLDMARPRPGRSHSATAVPDTLPEQALVQSTAGIDMARPRPRPAARRAPVSVPGVESETVTDADLIALGKLMSRSIKNAQPGRSVG